MDKREKVIKGLEHHAKGECAGCPYVEGWHLCTMGEREELFNDALELLKAQEPHVMTWDEAQKNINEGPFIIMELRDSTGTEVDYGVLVDDSYEMSEGSLLTVRDFWMLKEEYNKRFRCWTSRPTDEQREATPWD